MEKNKQIELNTQTNEEINNIKLSSQNNSFSYKEIDSLNQKNNETNILQINNVNENSNSEEKSNLNNKFICIEEKKYRNIGNNIVLFNRFIFGPKNDLWLLILIMAAISFSWSLFIYFIGDFYSKYIYIFLNILFFLSQFFMLLSFLIEPGIIPRNSPDFIIKDNNEKENDKNEKQNEEKNNKIENKENNNRIENKENNNEIKKENIDILIPRIFTERICKTCKIIRPPGASHCRICDNCVLDFDHHCIFVSNCIGKRNHKTFFLFLIFGSIFAIFSTFYSAIVVIYVFIIHSNKSLIYLFKGNKFLLIFSAILMTFSLLYIRNPYCSWEIKVFPGIIGYLLFCYLYFKYFPKEEKSPRYFNPFIIAILGAAIGFGIFVIANLFGQIFHISRGYTIKQKSSIRQKMVYLALQNRSREMDPIYYRPLTSKEKFNNIISFLFKKNEKSLIIPERDLILTYQMNS